MRRRPMSPLKKVLSVVMIICVIALGGLFLIRRAASGPSVEEGNPAPDFTLGHLHGDMLSLSDFKGKAVMINFWATWCGPCRDEMPAMQRVYDEYRDDGFEIVAVNLQETEAAVARFIAELGVDFPVVYDLTGDVFDTYLVRMLPTTYFVDRDGIISSFYIGPMEEQYIDQRVRWLLDDSKEASV